MSLLFLKVKMSPKNFLCQLNEFEAEEPKIEDAQNFPWKSLFDVEPNQVWLLAETSYKFLKLVK